MLHAGALALLLLLFLTISFRGLTVVPPVYEDEPWQASTGWKIATQGVFGSDMFAGVYGMDRHYYAYLPVHPLLLALTFKIAGLGLLQLRTEPVLMGLLTLVLTYALGRRVAGRSVGLLAVALLLCVRLTGTTRYLLTGIPLVDLTRIARYDVVVPVFGLLSLHAYLSAASRPDWRLHVLAGLLAALAGLSHVYGSFWIVVLALLAVLEPGRWRAIGPLAAGFSVPMALYLAYVAGGIADWRGQVAEYGPRFGLLNAQWYVNNVLNEWHRYGPGLGTQGAAYLTRPGFWTMLIALPAAAIALGSRARRGERAAAAIVLPMAVFTLAFALLIKSKVVNYTLTMLPTAMIAVAWAAVLLWRWAGDDRRRWVRVALVCSVVAMALEGAGRLAVLSSAAKSTTPYDRYVQSIRAHIPAGSRVLGLHNYWLGLNDFHYLAWFVPLRRNTRCRRRSGRRSTRPAPTWC